YVRACVVDSNTFIDCRDAAYIDVGEVDGLQVTNNTVIRGWMAVGLRCPGLKQNITISGNNFQIQNRYVVGASYGMLIDSGPISNLTIDHNIMSFDGSGGGQANFWGINATLVTTATISNNTMEVTSLPLHNQIVGGDITMFGNRMSDGSTIPGLGN
ncbi:MAG TPA: hypothetical protein VGM62_12445, partial [Chthoniobacterales bacterium]